MNESNLTPFQYRALFFLIGCLGTRSLAAWLAYAKPQTLPLLSVLASIIATGFLVIYVGDLRSTGPEVFGDRIWWDSLRPVHAAFYGLFAYHALQGSRHAWIFLAIDVILGAVAWMVHHFV